VRAQIGDSELRDFKPSPIHNSLTRSFFLLFRSCAVVSYLLRWMPHKTLNWLQIF
jgi:hypothetical protein